MTTLQPIGMFFSGSRTLVVADPCLDGDAERITRARPGMWHAFVTRMRTRGWGMRNASLVLVHESMAGEVDKIQWRDSGQRIGDESAMLGIWALPKFREHKLSPPEQHESFYDHCSLLTRGMVGIEDPNFIAAGVMSSGAVCAPGLGSGVYCIDVAGQGEVVGIRMQFLCANDEHKDE